MKKTLLFLTILISCLSLQAQVEARKFACTQYDYRFSATADMASSDNPVKLIWDFGDGTTIEQTLVAGQTKYTMNHPYTAPNIYNVKVTPVKSNGALLTATMATAEVVDCAIKSNRQIRIDLKGKNEICIPPSFTSNQTTDVNINLLVGAPLNINYAVAGDIQTFQWKKDGADIAGATSATYSKSSVVAGDSGIYTLTLTPKEGCAPGTVTAKYRYIVNVLSGYTPDNSLIMTGKTCFDTRETQGINNNGYYDTTTGHVINRTDLSSPMPIGSWDYVVSNPIKTIQSVIWQADVTKFYSGTATSATPNTTFTVTYTDLQTIRDMVENSVRATPDQTIIITAYVIYSDGTKGQISKAVKIQDFVCCDGFVCEGCAYDYSAVAMIGAPGTPNAAGDWPRTITTVNNAYNSTQANKGIKMDGFVTYAQDTYYTAAPTGDLCVYKKDEPKVYHYANALAKCADGTSADGSLAVWYLPNYKEIKQIFAKLPGRGTDAKFGGPDNGGKAMSATLYWTSTESQANGSMLIDFSSGTVFSGYTTSKDQPTGYPVRCVRRM